ncbi:MAG: AarF/ABC1/UbiB kinase family protein, partial [Caulobacterales bacterium]
ATGPWMKVAQLLAPVPDQLPPEHANELTQLQTNAPAMGWPFVSRRMRAELGPDWESKFASFERTAAAAASLGQVHRAKTLDGRAVACKLQYPDMASAVEADIGQLQIILGMLRRVSGAIDPSEIGGEVADRLREELDYAREAKNTALYRLMLKDIPEIRVPAVDADLSTKRLLTMSWLDGRPLLEFIESDQETRNRLATLLFKAWWRPFAQYGVIHGDPHLGNYSFAEDGHALNLLDFGCVRIFPPGFVAGVVELWRALKADDRAGIEAAYARWGFSGLKPGAIDALNIWARFIYGPLIDDRVRTVADGVSPAEYGRREAWNAKEALKAHGPVKVPREFVFMDRAAIGLGAAFLRLRAELNFHDLFAAAIDGFDEAALSARQQAALGAVGISDVTN